jgi:hypothetical protein
MAIGNGVNLQPSYYGFPPGDVSFGWDIMNKVCPNIKTLRIEIEPDKEKQARSWIQQACGHGYTVIATYHSFKALETQKLLPPQEPKSSVVQIGLLMDAAHWWSANYTTILTADSTHVVKKDEILSAIAQQYYGDAEKYHMLFKKNRPLLTSPDKIYPGQKLTIPAIHRSFMINLMNEWGNHNLTAKVYARAYNAAIGIVRGAYPADLPIIIDVPGWGQETAVAASAVRGDGNVVSPITDPNIILSVHIYPDAFVHQKPASSKEKEGLLTTADLDDLASTRKPCMIGEFGNSPAGPANWKGLVQHAKNSLKWPVLGWAWNGDDTAGQMNMVAPRWRIGLVYSVDYGKTGRQYHPNPPYFSDICGEL